MNSIRFKWYVHGDRTRGEIQAELEEKGISLGDNDIETLKYFLEEIEITIEFDGDNFKVVNAEL